MEEYAEIHTSTKPLQCVSLHDIVTYNAYHSRARRRI